MKSKIILYFLLFFPFFISAQTSELNGRIVVLSSSGTDPSFTVSASFSSTMGFSASEVIVGDIIVARYVSGATHRRNLYEITSVSASGSNLTLGVTRLSGVSTSFFPTGTHAIVRKTNSGLLYDAANVSQEIESYTTNYNLGLLDGFKVDTVKISNDTLTLALENGTEFIAIIPGGSGANLSSSATSNDVTIISDSGTDAVIQAASANQAGVLTPAGYNLLLSTITSFSGDVTGVISLANASLDINPNVITSVELADNSVGTTEIQANAVTLTKLVDAPAFSFLGNNTGSTADPLYMTAAQAQTVLSVDDLITLSGISEGVQHNGTFTGSTIPDNQTTKAALQALETGVEGKLSTSLTSGQILVGSGSNIATARTMSGDGTISNTGVLTVTKQDQILFMDETSVLGTLGTVDTVKFTGTGVVASRASNTVTVNVSGGGGGGGDGIDTLTSVNNTISITPVTTDQYDIDVNVASLRTYIDTCYSISISGGNSGSQLWVCANGIGVSASWASNVLTIASTNNVKVKSADWTLVAADISVPADAGGVTNWVQVKFTNTRGNTGLTNLRIPVVQKTSIPGSGALSVTNAGSVDIDNNPVISVVGAASNSVTIRVGGLTDAGQGYHLKFTGIH